MRTNRLHWEVVARGWRVVALQRRKADSRYNFINVAIWENEDLY